MYCPKCGAQIPNGSRFCYDCGATIEIKKPSADSALCSLTIARADGKRFADEVAEILIDGEKAGALHNKRRFSVPLKSGRHSIEIVVNGETAGQAQIIVADNTEAYLFRFVLTGKRKPEVKIIDSGLLKNNTTKVKVQTRQAPVNNQNTQQAPRGNSHGFLWFLVILLLILAALLYFSPFTRDLYIYDDTDAYGILGSSALVQYQYEDVFRGTYLLVPHYSVIFNFNEPYYVINFDDSTYISDSNLNYSESLAGGLSTYGSYAYLDIVDSSTITVAKITYREPTFTERIYYAYRGIGFIKDALS